MRGPGGEGMVEFTKSNTNVFDFDIDAAYVKPNFIQFDMGGKTVGRLKLNETGDALVFTGNAEESAKVFFDYVIKQFADYFGREVREWI
jgi:hypothetical protein